jgi:hypothetical protein
VNALPDFRHLPAPLPLVTILHVATLTLHLLAMNAMVGSLFFLSFLRGRSAAPSVASAGLARLVPTLVTATVTLGVAPLLFLQLVYHRQVYAASIVSAWYWLGIIVAVIGIYLLAYECVRREGSPPRYGLLAPAFLLAVYVSLVYSGVFSLTERPALVASAWAADPSGTTFPPGFRAWGFRWLHMITGALAVGGLFVAWWTRHDASVARRARIFFLAAMGAALLAGFGYLLSLGDLVLPIMRSAAIAELTVAVLLALGGTHFAIKGRFGWAGGMIALSTLGMVAVRAAVRDLRLAGRFDPASIPVAPQWGVFLVFLVCLVAAVVTMVFLVRAFRERPSSPS